MEVSRGGSIMLSGSISARQTGADHIMDGAKLCGYTEATDQEITLDVCLRHA